MIWTTQDAKDALKEYNGRIPDEPKGYEFLEFRVPKTGDIWLGNTGAIFTTSREGDKMPRFILKKLAPQYRFICDDPEPRKPQKGDWFMPNNNTYGTGNKQMFIQAIANFTTHEHVIFRREEIAQ